MKTANPPKQLLPPWQRERANRLNRLCTAIQRKVESGRTLHRALINAAWWSKGRTFRTDPKRKLRFSYSTLQRCFYIWKHAGQSPEAFALRFKPRRRVTLSKKHVRELLRECFTPGVLVVWPSVRRLARKLNVATRTVYRHLPADATKAIRRLHRARLRTRKALSNAEEEFTTTLRRYR